ncbi:hypothetical protein [Lysobacter humi (ex Lee et al. 2017)]
MNRYRNALLALAVAAALTGCNPGREEARTAQESGTAIERNVETNMQAAMDEARTKMAQGNIGLDGRGDAPKAEITPKGDLLIDGKAVAITDEQRMMLLDYRAQVAGVASAGMDVGVQGARLAARAVGEAVRGVFSGRADEVDKRVEAQAEPIRVAALKLCDRLPAMFEAQQKLAVALPAFAPYATMEKEDFDDCRKDAMDGKAPTPPAAPTAPGAPPAPAAAAQGAKQLTAKDVLGKPELPKLPELPDPTG